MLHVIRIVVVDIHGGFLFEALYQQSLTVHICKSQRTGYLCHAFLLAPSDHLVHQGTAYLHVVDEIEPAKTDLLAIPALVGAMVDDGSDTSHHLPVLESHEIVCLTEVKACVTVVAQGVHLVRIKKWDCLRAVTV